MLRRLPLALAMARTRRAPASKPPPSASTSASAGGRVQKRRAKSKATQPPPRPSPASAPSAPSPPPSSPSPSTAAFLADLDRGLAAASVEKTRVWWEKYLRGAATFRGVPMAGTRACVQELWGTHGLASLDTAAHLALARACMAQTASEDKLAGVLLLAEHALSDLTLAHVPELARPLDDGHLADWNVVDWYCVKVLGPFIGRPGEADRPEMERRARAIAAWASGATLWQRRAAAVAFVYHVDKPEELFPGLHALVLGVAHDNSTDSTRWSQTSVGWLLRELSRHHKPLVRKFLKAHPALSLEARKNASKYL